MQVVVNTDMVGGRIKTGTLFQQAKETENGGGGAWRLVESGECGKVAMEMVNSTNKEKMWSVGSCVIERG